MDSTKITVSFTLAIIATLFALSAATNDTQSIPISPFCDNQENGNYTIVCSGMILDAKTWPRAMKNALKSMKRVCKAVQMVPYEVALKMPSNIDKEQKKIAKERCRKAYKETVIANIKACITLVEKNDFNNLKAKIGEINLGDCSMALKELKVTNDAVTAFDNTIVKLINILHKLVDKKPQV